jgi:addiction module HigA family antidote
MAVEKIDGITPGEILLEEFMKPLEITAYKLAKDTMMPLTRVSAILKGKRSITTDTALRLSRYFGNSVEFWIGIQTECDLRKEKKLILQTKQEIQQIQPFKRASL